MRVFCQVVFVTLAGWLVVLLIGLAVGGIARAASCDERDRTCTSTEETCAALRCADGDILCEAELAACPAKAASCRADVTACVAVADDCAAGRKECKLVDGAVVEMTAAEKAARAQDEADFLTRIDPVPPPSAAEIWEALKARGVLTDADVGR